MSETTVSGTDAYGRELAAQTAIEVGFQLFADWSQKQQKESESEYVWVSSKVPDAGIYRAKPECQNDESTDFTKVIVKKLGPVFVNTCFVYGNRSWRFGVQMFFLAMGGAWRARSKISNYHLYETRKAGYEAERAEKIQSLIASWSL